MISGALTAFTVRVIIFVLGQMLLAVITTVYVPVLAKVWAMGLPVWTTLPSSKSQV